MKLFRSVQYSIILAIIQVTTVCCTITLIQPAVSRVEAQTSPTNHRFKVTTVFIIRHAEKEATPTEDPPLSEIGKFHSEELARILERARIKSIYTSQFLRTKQTAEPLARYLGVTVIVVPIKMNPSNPKKVSGQSIKEMTDKILERDGDGILVVGHSNTVPQIIKKLGGDIIPVIDEKEFDDLFIVTVYGKKKAKVIHLKYGSQK